MGFLGSEALPAGSCQVKLAKPECRGAGPLREASAKGVAARTSQFAARAASDALPDRSWNGFLPAFWDSATWLAGPLARRQPPGMKAFNGLVAAE